MITTHHSPTLFLACFAATIAGCATGQVDPSGQTVTAISGGAADPTHTGVVGIVIVAPGFSGTCSGTLITPNLVLTARHCVSRLSASEAVVCARFSDQSGGHEVTTPTAPFAASSFRVTRDETITRGATFSAVAEVLVPPDSTGASLCGNDLALLRLTQPMDAGTPVEPRLDVAPAWNENYTAVGYGITGPDAGDQGLRRMRTALSVGHVGTQSSNGVEIEAEAEWAGNTGTCPGDSGGPAIDSANRVFGVLSRGAAASCDRPVYTRVDSWANWIREQTRASTASAGIVAPAWIDATAAVAAASGEAGDATTALRGCSSAPSKRGRRGDLGLTALALLAFVALGPRGKGSRDEARRTQ